MYTMYSSDSSPSRTSDFRSRSVTCTRGRFERHACWDVLKLVPGSTSVSSLLCIAHLHEASFARTNIHGSSAAGRLEVLTESAGCFGSPRLGHTSARRRRSSSCVYCTHCSSRVLLLSLVFSLLLTPHSFPPPSLPKHAIPQPHMHFRPRCQSVPRARICRTSSLFYGHYYTALHLP